MINLRAAASPYTVQINALLVHAKDAMQQLQSMPMDETVRRRIITAYNDIVANGIRLKTAAAAGTISDGDFRAFRTSVTSLQAAVLDPVAYAEPIFPTGTSRPAPTPEAAMSTMLPEPSSFDFSFSNPTVLYGSIAAGAVALGVGVWGYKKRGWFKGRRRR